MVEAKQLKKDFIYRPENIKGQFSVIYADPPWKYGSNGPRGGRFGDIGYNQMTLKEICEYPMHHLPAKDCALFVWATSPFLMDAGEVIKAWGFKYCRVDAVWEKTTKNNKPHAACGPWGMTDAEFLLMGIKGSMCSKQIGKANLYTVVSEPYTGKHSEKPEVFRQRIERRFGNVPRIELFARKPSPLWVTCGDQLN